MDLGKIDKKSIEGLFSDKLGKKRKNVLQGPAFGVDTGIIRLTEEKCLVLSSDPASFIPALGVKESAWLTVILTANDIATSGFMPEYAQFVLNLSNTINEADLREYWNYIHHFCSEIGISIIGGHTGFDDIGNSTLAGGVTMFAMGATNDVKSAAFARPNQDLILTKSAAISSASILAKSFPHYVQENLGERIHKALVDSFSQTSILREVQVLKEKPETFSGVSAMHDVTEGGVLGAIFELCEASKVGVNIEIDKILIGKEQKELCQLFNIPPLRCVGAGSLLIACEKEESPAILNKFHAHHISASIIGTTTELENGKRIIHGNKKEIELKYWDKDPYWEAFFNAFQKGLK